MEYLINFLSNYLDLQTEDIKPAIELRDLVEDSLMLIELIMEIEDRFKIYIHDDDINSLITIQDLFDYIERKNIKK